MITVDNPVEKVYERWSEAVKEVVGDNYSMDMSKIPAKFPYMRLMYMGSTFADGDIEGNESAVTISFQVESFSNSRKKLTQVYKLDEVSHKAMRDMGFRRTYNGQVENVDQKVARVVSRYSRLYTGQLLGE